MIDELEHDMTLQNELISFKHPGHGGTKIKQNKEKTKSKSLNDLMLQNQRLQHSFSSFSKFAERKKTSRQLRTMLFFVLPDQNTFHALKSIFFKNKIQ